MYVGLKLGHFLDRPAHPHQKVGRRVPLPPPPLLGGNLDILACSSSWALLGSVVSDVHHFDHRKISATKIASNLYRRFQMQVILELWHLSVGSELKETTCSTLSDVFSYKYKSIFITVYNYAGKEDLRKSY